MPSQPPSIPRPAPIVDLTFPHAWEAQILPARPLILPQRHFVYPGEVEEVEHGALEVLVRPDPGRPAADAQLEAQSGPENSPSAKNSFLATCALGFRDPSVPTGLWSCPKPEEICAVAGGYAYIIDTNAPERFTMLQYRPVFAIHPIPAPNPAQGLILFVGNRTILAWRLHGQAWESVKLSDEGLTIIGVEDHTLHGRGWSMMTDEETPFALDLRDGKMIQP